MKTKTMFCRALGFKENAIVIFTDSEWILAFQPGNNDLEIFGKSAIPATCFELGFNNKQKLRKLIKGEAKKIRLVIGEAYIDFETDALGELHIDLGRKIASGDEMVFDTKTIPNAKTGEFLEALTTIVNY